MKAWIYQSPKYIKKLGVEKAPWYVGWYDPDGNRRSKSCGVGATGKRTADKERERIAAQLLTGTYKNPEKLTWEDFRKEYEEKVLAAKEPRHRDNTLAALAQFERIAKPKKVQAITSQMVALFVAKRKQEDGLRAGLRVSPATVNKELRYLRAVLRKAHRWDYLPKLPEFEFLKEPKKLPTYVPPEHFAALYKACDSTRFPKKLAVPPADWWRALLVMAYMTGWRIGSLLALTWDDVDLEAGTALTRAEVNKGRRDQLVPLHEVILAHLRKIKRFDSIVFPWDHSRRTLFAEFGRLQRAADVKPSGPKEQYGFHDLRRAFATMNVDRLQPDALQHLMQHKDYQTTQRYINMARQLNPAVQNLFVPELPETEDAERA